MNLLISATELHQKLSLLVKDLHKNAWNFLAALMRVNLLKALKSRRSKKKPIYHNLNCLQENDKFQDM